ncbi:putative uncharacterized protein [Acidiphilium sp. CAG:727]|nr:putative uncharacterized protein [Acidiphilium sp. CAG:727]
MHFGSGENKHSVFRGFFERFQKSVESLGGEHVDFVYNIDFILTAYRRILNFIANFPDVFYLVVRGGVHLDYIEIRRVCKSLTNRAFAARRTVDGRKAVYRLCEYFRGGSFTRSARAAKQIGVSYLVRIYLVYERSYDVILPD